MYSKLISVETKAQFELIQQGENPFPQSSIVVIEDTRQIWTHGIFINGVTSTANNPNVTLRIAGVDYNVALGDYYHKKTQDVDLGLHSYTEGILTYPASYSIVADTHTLLRYSQKADPHTGVHIGNANDKTIFDSKYPLSRIYQEGAITKNIPIFDSTNVSITVANNTIQYNFAEVYKGTIYYAQHDKSSIAPQNSSVTNSRLGGNSEEGWIVMNVNDDGTAANYYQLKLTNLSYPSLYIKGSSYSTFTKLISEHDVFTGPSGSTSGTSGIVPAPTATNTFLKGDGTWSPVLPISSSVDTYLHRNQQGNLEWVSITLPEETKSVSPIAFAVSTSWAEVTEINLSELLEETGTYAINILYGSSIYSGVASIIADTTISSDEEVLMHECGNNSNVHLYAKIAPSSVNSKASLWLAASNPLNNYSLTISFRKLL